MPRGAAARGLQGFGPGASSGASEPRVRLADAPAAGVIFGARLLAGQR